MDYDRSLEVILSIIGTLVVVALGIFAFTYKKVEIIIIEDRWWVTTTSVKYDVTTLETQCHPKQVCTGFGDTKTCHTEQDCHLEPVTRTYTRCTNDLAGKKLPITYPGPACQQQYGDYIRQYETYRVRYHTEDTPGSKESIFVSGLWNCLQLGARRQITKNILGTIGFCEEDL